jgi:hypothetical protein
MIEETGCHSSAAGSFQTLVSAPGPRSGGGERGSNQSKIGETVRHPSSASSSQTSAPNQVPDLGEERGSNKSMMGETGRHSLAAGSSQALGSVPGPRSGGRRGGIINQR